VIYITIIHCEGVVEIFGCAFFVLKINQIYGGKTMNRELLEKPFEGNQIKQREGNFGKTLDYIEGHAVIARLNDAFDANWSFEIIDREILNETGEVLVQGKLSTNGVIKTQFGSSRITKARESGEMVSLADDLKAAATDALKKAATLLGVGLHLYAGAKQSNHNYNPPKQQNTHTPNERGGNGGNGSGNHDPGNNGNGRITAKQHKYILNLIKDAGMTKSELNEHCTQMYGSVMDYLNRNDASSLIDWLLSK
jgi:hypothetical protein